MKSITGRVTALVLAASLCFGGFSSARMLHGTAPPAGFTGFLDTYNALGATWGVSAYKLTSAYSGNWGTVERESDNSTSTIGFLSTGKVDVASFNTFCAGTNCFLTSWVDQVGSISPAQATFAKMPRVIVDANSLLAVCPQPGSSMTMAFNSAVNTAKVHMFAVAKAAYSDNRGSQAGLPTVTATGNITSGSTAIASMSSQVGISVASGNPQLPGVTDSAGFLPNSPTVGTVGTTNLSALPTGTTGTLAFQPGNLSPTGTQTADTLTFTNAVLGGVWIANGPASSTFYSSAYWGVGMALPSIALAGDWVAPRNGSGIANNSNFQNVLGNGMRGQWAVYDYDTFTTQLNYDGVSLGQLTGTTSNVTYTTNVGMTLFADANGNENLSNTCFETMVLFPATETANRVAMAQALMAQDAIAFPFAPATSDGFAMTGAYQPNDIQGISSVYGALTFGPDVWGMSWDPQSGGYTWPSVAFANNINNSTTMWRFVVEQGDSDINITQAERAEVNGTTTTSPGNSFSFFYQFQFEALPNEAGDWCYSGQIHYNGVTPGADSPDLVTFACLGNKAQFITQKTVSGNPVSTNCGSSFTITTGTTYAVVGTGFWSTNHTSDTLEVWAGPNGGALSVVCNLTAQALWDNDTGAYLKAGIYRGFPWSNVGTVIERVSNPQFAPTTANAYSAYITTQPALPTHP